MIDREGVETIRCGPSDIIWWPSHVMIDESELKGRLHTAEWERAQTMGAATRRSEYLRARYLVREILQYDDLLPASSHGAPSWPTGWRGSISHKDGHVAVAVSPDKALLGLGIDVENCGRVRLALESRIVQEEESRLLNKIEGQWDRASLLALVFSFKESLFKCHFPLGLRMFYFHDAMIEDIDLALGCVRARLLIDSSPWTKAGSLVEGHLTLRSENAQTYVLTSVSLRS